MELQQKLNLKTRIFNQGMGLQHICTKYFIVNIKGKQ